MWAPCAQVMPIPSDQPAKREDGKTRQRPISLSPWTWCRGWQSVPAREMGMTPLTGAWLPIIQFLGYTGFPNYYKMNIVKHEP